MGKLKIDEQLENMAPDIWSFAKHSESWPPDPFNQCWALRVCQMPLYWAIATGASP